MERYSAARASNPGPQRQGQVVGVDVPSGHRRQPLAGETLVEQRKVGFGAVVGDQDVGGVAVGQQP
jgi:hypothetical protein